MINHSRPIVDRATEQHLLRAIRAHHLASGPEVAALEQKLAAIFTPSYPVAVASGTAALYLSLLALNLPPGKEVIIPSYSCRSLYAAVRLANLCPICADIAPNQPTIDPTDVSARLTPKTAAIIATHQFGFAAPIPALQSFGLPVIEDCAQGFGGLDNTGKLLGLSSDLAVLSFFATKPAGGAEGGAILTQNAMIAEKIKALRNCDQDDADPLSFNFKMSDVHAVLAQGALTKLPKQIAARRKIADRYDQTFAAYSLRQRTPQALCFRYLLDIPDHLSTILALLQKRGVMARRPIPHPLHHLSGQNCPRTDYAYAHYLSLPIYPGLTANEIKTVIQTTEKALNKTCK